MGERSRREDALLQVRSREEKSRVMSGRSLGAHPPVSGRRLGAHPPELFDRRRFVDARLPAGLALARLTRPGSVSNQPKVLGPFGLAGCVDVGFVPRFAALDEIQSPSRKKKTAGRTARRAARGRLAKTAQTRSGFRAPLLTGHRATGSYAPEGWRCCSQACRSRPGPPRWIRAGDRARTRLGARSSLTAAAAELHSSARFRSSRVTRFVHLRDVPNKLLT